jgi:hypothetical protein
MKKSIVMFVLAIATMSFVSCKEEAKEETATETSVEVTEEAPAEEMHMASYACPMNCENGKTYDAPGKCPVCEMDLVENTEGHEGHNH